MSTDFNWDRFSSPELQDKTPKKKTKTFSWDEYEDPLDQGISDNDSSFGRHVSRSGARVLETILGLPGDIQESALALTGKGAKLVGGPEEEVERSKELVRAGSPFQSSQDVKENITESLSGEYLKPQSRGEKFSDEVVQDATSLLLPVKGLGSLKSAKRILGAIGTAAGANALSEAVGELGVGETGKAATKLGSMLLMGSFTKSSPNSYVKKLYEQAESSIKGDPKVKVPVLQNKLVRMKRDLSRGVDAPSETAVTTVINKLLKKFKNGKIPVKDLWASKRSINEIQSEILYGASSKANKARARKLFSPINQALNANLKKYGSTNPKFYKIFKEAEEGFAALKQSEKVGTFLKKHSKYSPLSPLLYPLVHMMPSASLGTAASAAATYKLGQMGYRIYKSPTIRRYYKEVLREASKKNAGGMNRALKRLDKELVKEDKKSDQNQ